MELDGHAWTILPAMAERVLTLRELNRALLARQLLLERRLLRCRWRSSGSAHFRPSGRPRRTLRSGRGSTGFRIAQLERALAQRRVVKATLMRSTLHLVSSADYPVYAAAIVDARRPEARAAVPRRPRRGGRAPAGSHGRRAADVGRVAVSSRSASRTARSSRARSGHCGRSASCTRGSSTSRRRGRSASTAARSSRPTSGGSARFRRFRPLRWPRRRAVPRRVRARPRWTTWRRGSASRRRQSARSLETVAPTHVPRRGGASPLRPRACAAALRRTRRRRHGCSRSGTHRSSRMRPRAEPDPSRCISQARDRPERRRRADVPRRRLRGGHVEGRETALPPRAVRTRCRRRHRRELEAEGERLLEFLP